MNPQINILMPVYNSGQYIEGAIRSALSQSFGDFELLIVDDRSTDNSAEIIRRFNDPRIRYYINDRNLGSTKNFNRCLSLASAEYLVYLHTDDMLLPDMLKKNRDLLASDPSLGFVFSACEIIDAKGDLQCLNRPYAASRTWAGRDFYKKHLYRNAVLFPAMMIRKACLDKVGHFDEELTYTPDWDLWLRLEAAGYSVGFQKEPLGQYRVHPKSVTSQLIALGKTDIEQFLLIKKHLSSSPAQNILSPRERKRLAAMYRRRAVRSCYLRSRDALLRGNFALAIKNLAVLKEWRCDPRIAFDDDVIDRFLSFFSLLGIVIE